LVCIEKPIHTNPFTMYWYVFGLYWRSNVWIDFLNTCSILTEYKPILLESVCIETWIQEKY
jgi:hypothetical protein